MAKLLKLRRGSTSQHSSFTGAEGEVTVDTDKESLVVHNGSQAGGFPLLRQDLSNLVAGTIDTSDIANLLTSMLANLIQKISAIYFCITIPLAPKMKWPSTSRRYRTPV
mgnify:CR=1 FL=1